MTREYRRSLTITRATMLRMASLFKECAPVLRRAGDPGRYQPARKLVRQACRRLTKASRFLAQAIAASDASGAVVAGTPEEAQFNRALTGAFEAAGNAVNDFALARERANAIEAQFGR